VLTALALVVLAVPVPQLSAGSGNNDEHWVATWSTALHQPSPGPPGLKVRSRGHGRVAERWLRDPKRRGRSARTDSSWAI
jgi:hypothetical protein